MNLCNLFPDKVVRRLDEVSQVARILEEGARERGVEAHLIDATLPGVGPMSVWRVFRRRCECGTAYMADEDITAMARSYGRDSFAGEEMTG